MNRGRCERHGRGTTAQRGYDSKHDRIRAALDYAVKQGRVRCWRCNQPILPGDEWDLGHADHSRVLYKGPEHASCNRSAAAKLRNA